MDELSIHGIQIKKTQQVTSEPFGTPVTYQDIESRLESNLYTALSDRDDDSVQNRIDSAQIYVGAILRNFNVSFDLDNAVIRELVILNTIYEMHISHGHEEAGKEYRYRAKDIVLVTWGDYKDNDNKEVNAVQSATVVTPRPSSQSPYRKAFGINKGY